MYLYIWYVLIVPYSFNATYQVSPNHTLTDHTLLTHPFTDHTPFLHPFTDLTPFSHIPMDHSPPFPNPTNHTPSPHIPTNHIPFPHTLMDYHLSKRSPPFYGIQSRAKRMRKI